MRRTRRNVLMILFISIISLLSVYLGLYSNYLKDTDEIYSRYATKLERESEALISLYSEWAVQIWETEINTEPVLTLLHNAYNANDEAEKDAYRKELYNLLEPFYANLINHNFRQIHFHEKNNLSFLRMHRPSRYGDDLTGIRYSVESVNQTRKPLSGFEEGRIFNGYRNVFPLEYKGENLGTVEVSFNMSLLINKLEERFYGKAQFIILQSVIDEKVFDEEKSNYIPWQMDSSFLLDKGISESCILENVVEESDKTAIKRILDKELKSNNESFTIHLPGGEGLILSFRAVRNFDKRIVAYIFTRSPDDSIIDLQKSFLIISISFALLFFLLLFFLYYYNNSEKKLEELVIHDQLTGAFSRRIVLEKLKYELERFRRYGGPFSIAMIDIDHFKAVNDEHGHLAGDAVLKEMASLISGKIRTTDIFGRYGGEEFLLILPETDLSMAHQVLDLIRIEVGYFLFSKAGRITISIGVAEVSPEEAEINPLIEVADTNLYLAKKEGRNRVVS